jgi:mannose-6-phosphate isomerase-like protein (cupin superfamily)
MKVSKKSAEHYKWGENCDGWHLVKREELSIIHEKMPPGTSEVRHYHQKARQFFFVLSGVATMEMDGTRIVLHAHVGIEVPPNTPHQMMNQSDEDVEFLVISHPKSHGDRVIVE